MYAGGWVGATWPKEYGGRGAKLEQSIVYGEELARVKAPTLVHGLGIAVVGPDPNALSQRRATPPPKKLESP